MASQRHKAFQGPDHSGLIEGKIRLWHDIGRSAEEIEMTAGQHNGGSLAFYASGFPKRAPS